MLYFLKKRKNKIFCVVGAVKTPLHSKGNKLFSFYIFCVTTGGMYKHRKKAIDVVVLVNFSRVEHPVFLLDEFLVDVRVNLRGADVCMAQQFLQDAQVHARLQAVRGKAVAEGVRRDLFGKVGRVLLHDFPSTHAAHRLATGI